MARAEDAARRAVAALSGTFQTRRRTSRAVITSVQRDNYGKAVAATATVDGAPAQKVYIDQGATITEGDVFDVENRGGVAGPSWFAMRRVMTTIPVPSLPFGTTLPVPLGLTLTTGISYTTLAASVWIYATWYLLPAAWGILVYDLQYLTGDEDAVTVSYGPLQAGDPGLTAELIASISETATVIPRTWSYDLDFPYMGVIRIDDEKIAYSSCTRLKAPWIVPWSVSDFNFALLDYVEDSFTDTDTTDLASHTPDYDRESGGWYAIPTYSTNWAISGNKAVASPGASFPYSSALIAAHSGGSYGERIAADWTIPSSGNFGYITDFVDEDTYYRTEYDVANDYIQIVRRAGAVESTGWHSDALGLTVGQTYRFTLNYYYTREVWITISGGDLDEDIDLYMAYTPDYWDTARLGIYSNVAVTVDNLMIDDPREWDIADHQYANFAYKQAGFSWCPITDNYYSAVSHLHMFTTTDNPGGYGVKGQIHPCFLGLTRGFEDTTAASHTAGATIYQEKQGALIPNLVGGEDYNVRIRARLGDSLVSPWSSWSTIETAIDEVAPSDPTGFVAISGVGRIDFQWTGPTRTTDPDLVGFVLYRATSSAGAGATQFAEFGVGLDAGTALPAGEYGYWNLKAKDYYGNLSDYALETWVLAASGYNSGGQIATNTDFEVAGSGSLPLYYQTWGSAGAGPTVTYESTGGYLGGACLKVVLLTSVGLSCYRTVSWPTLTENQDIPGVYPALYRMSAYIKPTGTADMDDIMGYFYMQLVCTDSSNFMTFGYYPVATGYQYIGDGWYRYWRDMLWLNSSYATYPYLAFHMVFSQDVGTHPDGTFYVDRVQLELGPNMTEWGPNMAWLAADSGIRYDTSSLLSASLIVDQNGQIASDLEPAADDTYWLGKANNWQGVALKDTLSATPGGVSGDSLLFVDTDGKIKIRHGTATAISLEEQGTKAKLDTFYTTGSAAITYEYDTTVCSMSVTVPTGCYLMIWAAMDTDMDQNNTSAIMRIWDGVTTRTFQEWDSGDSYINVSGVLRLTRTGTYTIYIRGRIGGNYDYGTAYGTLMALVVEQT